MPTAEFPGTRRILTHSTHRCPVPSASPSSPVYQHPPSCLPLLLELFRVFPRICAYLRIHALPAPTCTRTRAHSLPPSTSVSDVGDSLASHSLCIHCRRSLSIYGIRYTTPTNYTLFPTYMAAVLDRPIVLHPTSPSHCIYHPSHPYISIHRIRCPSCYYVSCVVLVVHVHTVHA